MKMTILGSVLAGSTLLASIAQAEDTISAVHAFPETLIYTKSFLSFVDKVNAAGEGVVQISHCNSYVRDRCWCYHSSGRYYIEYD